MKEMLPKANDELVPLERPFTSEIPKLRKLAVAGGLSGLANDTKWNELLKFMRSKGAEEWTPCFRFKCIDSERISGWDGEWFYHLPFPFVSVHWLDLRFTEEIYVAKLLPRKRVDHSIELLEVLSAIGLDFEKGAEVIRIFAYSPRDYTGFKRNVPESE